MVELLPETVGVLQRGVNTGPALLIAVAVIQIVLAVRTG